MLVPISGVVRLRPASLERDLISIPEAIRATYYLEAAGSLDAAAAQLAGEQSTGTFVRVPGETEAIRDRHAARVVSIEELEPYTSDGSSRRAAEVVIEIPAA